MEIYINGQAASYELVDLEGKQHHRVTIGDKVFYIAPSYGESDRIIWRDVDGFTDDEIQGIGDAILAQETK